jgi:hypothetical protein
MDIVVAPIADWDVVDTCVTYQMYNAHLCAARYIGKCFKGIIDLEVIHPKRNDERYPSMSEFHQKVDFELSSTVGFRATGKYTYVCDCEKSDSYAYYVDVQLESSSWELFDMRLEIDFLRESIWTDVRHIRKYVEHEYIFDEPNLLNSEIHELKDGQPALLFDIIGQIQHINFELATNKEIAPIWVKWSALTAEEKAKEGPETVMHLLEKRNADTSN